MMRASRSLQARGFTLIELMIVVAIVGVLLALVGPSMRSIMEVQRLRGAHAQLATDLQFVRSEAMRLNRPVHLAARPSDGSQPGCYTIFTDSIKLPPFSAACDCRQPAGSRCAAATTQEIRTVSLSASPGVSLAVVGGSRFGIDPGNGGMIVAAVDFDEDRDPEFRVHLVLDSARKLETQLSYAGRVRSCTPAGSTVSGTAC